MIFTRYLILAGKKEGLLVLSYIYLFVRKLFENSLLQFTRISTSCKIYFKLINNTGIRIGFVEISS